MMTKQNRKSDEITFSEYKKSGRSYVRARQWVTLIDESVERMEGSGKNRVDARAALQLNIEKRNERIQYGMKKDDGDITLAEAVKNLIEERAKEYDREKGREARRDVSTKREWDVFHSLLCPFEIANKKLNCIFVKDIETYRKQLSNARYDKHVTKKKHEPEYVYYSASTLNRIIRLVVTAIDDYYLYRPEKSPAIVLKQFKQSSPAKTEADFLVGEEFEIALAYFQKIREQPKYALDITCADVFTVALLIGARPGEILGLQKRDWNEKTGELSIQRTGEYEDGRTKTVGSVRVLTPPEIAAGILNRRCYGIPADDLIFPGTKKNLLSPSNLNKKLKRWLAEAGITKNLHPHSLRGSSGTYLLDHDVPIEVVSRMFGHQNVSTTQNFYSTYTETRRKKDATEICNVFDSLADNMKQSEAAK